MSRTTPEERLRAYMDAGDYESVSILCEQQMLETPDRMHWWGLYLGMALNELKQFDEALSVLEEVEEDSDFCPLAKWYRACVMYDQGCYADALSILTALIGRCRRWLRDHDDDSSCWEDDQHIRELVNDCRAKIGFCHGLLGDHAKARKWLRDHLVHRKRGQFSTYDASDIQRSIRNSTQFSRGGND